MIEQTWQIGDCRDIMREMDADSIDLIVTDPPYFMVNKSGEGFMGKEWDSVSTEAEHGLTKTQSMYKRVREFHIYWMTEAIRVLKPGAFAFIMSSPRQDVLSRMIVAAGESGFDTRFTSIYWAFASGFPKAGNVSKLIDKRLGAKREVVGVREDFAKRAKKNNFNQFTSINKSDNGINTPSFESHMGEITAPATSEAKTLDGSYGGFQPKPAVEVIMVVMKPLSEKTYVDQALANRKGITWLDDARIPYQSEKDIENATPWSPDNIKTGIFGKLDKRTPVRPHNQGRFPANLLVSDDVLNDGTNRNSCKSTNHHDEYGSDFKFGGGISDPSNQYDDSGSFSRYFDLDAWWNERIAHLPKEAQKTFPFMIVPKASKSEKGANNKHPTVKPVKLFSWLMTLGSREGDLVLDPFLGSGVALAAGRLTNRSVIGCEIDPQWEHLYADRCMKHTPTLDTYF